MKKEKLNDILTKPGHWEYIQANFEEVRLDKIEGRNFLSRLELVLASAI